jgi:hypothetical protein
MLKNGGFATESGYHRRKFGPTSDDSFQSDNGRIWASEFFTANDPYQPNH